MRTHDDYLHPELFRTEYDDWPSNRDYKKIQYENGLRIGSRSHSIGIAINGVWSASLIPDGMINSVEVIGYHACTADLLQGFLDSKAPIIVYTEKEGQVYGHWIRGAEMRMQSANRSIQRRI